MIRPIDMDHNATTPVLPEVLEAMLPFFADLFGKPSSAHVFGQKPLRAVALDAEQVAALVNAHPDEIHFTSGCIEANSLAVRGVTARSERLTCSPPASSIPPR